MEPIEWEEQGFDEVYETSARDYVLVKNDRTFRLRVLRALLPRSPYQWIDQVDEKMFDDSQSVYRWLPIFDRPRSVHQAKNEGEALRAALRDLSGWIDGRI